MVRKRIYHVEGAELENLPEHGDQSAQTTAEVILAFPVDDSHRPIIEQQHVYSFLPMRQEGFKVSCSFALALNGQLTVTDCNSSSYNRILSPQQIVKVFTSTPEIIQSASVSALYLYRLFITSAKMQP